ncbi:MAG: DMT family transporter [Actinomycetota bacterium]
MSRRGLLLFIALGLIWGLPYLLIKVAVDHVSPPVLVFCRVAMGAAILLPIAFRRGAIAPLRPVLRWVLAFAVVEISVPWVLLTFAETRVSSAFAALMISATPLVGAVFAQAFRLDDRLHGTRLLGLALGVAGVAALVGLDVEVGGVAAVAALVVTSAGYALGPMIVTTKLQGVPSVGVIAVSFLANAVGYAPFAVAGWPRATVPTDAWLAIAVLGVLCTAVAFLVFFALIAEVGPTRTTVITYVNPAVAVLLGIVVLGERLTAGIAVGFPLVLLGSFLATRRAPAMEDEPVPA